MISLHSNGSVQNAYGALPQKTFGFCDAFRTQFSLPNYDLRLRVYCVMLGDQYCSELQLEKFFRSIQNTLPFKVGMSSKDIHTYLEQQHDGVIFRELNDSSAILLGSFDTQDPFDSAWIKLNFEKSVVNSICIAPGNLNVVLPGFVADDWNFQRMQHRAWRFLFGHILLHFYNVQRQTQLVWEQFQHGVFDKVIEYAPDINVSLRVYVSIKHPSQAWKKRLSHFTGQDEQILIANLDHEDVRFRYISAKALGTIKSQKAMAKLIERLQNDPDSQVRYTCAKALKSFPTDNTIDALFQALEDQDIVVRNVAVEMLGELKVHEAKERILEFKKTYLYPSAQFYADKALKDLE